MKACVISLGCPKNLCDSEVIMGKLAAAGYELTTNEKAADLFVVNTCAFLKTARQEALETLRSLKKFKKPVYVAGCLPKYWYAREPVSPLARLKKREHGYTGLRVNGIIDSVKLYDSKAPRIKATPPWTAYVKIAEGCDNRCSYCLIPKIRGKLRARKVGDILKEVRWLARRGVKEIIFIAQDTTAHPRLPTLLRKASRIKGLHWIRLMYAHPEHLTDETLKTIKTNKTIVKYVDLPIQHISDKILKLMNRSSRPAHQIYNLISKLRREKIRIRTTLIVGFPGETREDFEKLLELVKWARFDRLGVFKYSKEAGTPAFKMRGQVPEKVKSYRFHKLMTLQNRISKELNSKLIGKKLEVLYEGQGKGRTAFDAPEIDGYVKFKSRITGIRPGKFVKAKIVRSTAYGLVGRLVPT